MPIIPRVNLAPLPSARLSATPLNRMVPEGAFGGGPGNALAGLDQGLSPIHAEASRMAAEEKQKADAVAVTAASAAASQAMTDTLWGDNGVLTRKGQDAFTAPEDARQAYFAKTGQIRASLGNDEQRAAFDHLNANNWSAIDEQVQRHVATQRQAFDDNTTDAAIANLKNQAIQGYTDPKIVQSSIDGIKQNATDYGARNGWSDAQTKELTAKQVSDAHAGVLARLVDTRQDQTAAQYFQAHRDELVGTQLTTAERLVTNATADGDALRTATDIIKNAATPDEMFHQVDAIQDDARKHDKVRAYVRDHLEDLATARAQDRATRLDKMESLLGQNGGRYDQLPKSELDQLEGRDQVSLQETAEKLRHPKTQTNVSVLTHLVNLSALNDATRAQFNAMELSKYRGQLSDEDYTRILYLQRTSRMGEERTADAATRRGEQREEATVLKGAEAARKANAGTQMLRDRMKAQGKSDADIDKVMATVPQAKAPAVAVPQWMADSAAHDGEYADYLRAHGVPVAPPNAVRPSASASPPLPPALNPYVNPFNTQTPPPAPQRPRVAGAPMPDRRAVPAAAGIPAAPTAPTGPAGLNIAPAGPARPAARRHGSSRSF